MRRAGIHSQSVLAQDQYCPSSPTNWDILNCNGYCAITGNTWKCDMSGAGAATMVVMVEGYGADGNTDYSAWGHFHSGETQTDFCCPVADADAKKGIANFEIVGGPGGDSLAFTWDSRTYNLQSFGKGTIAGLILGGVGNDVIKGSDSDDATYSEELEGQDGDDTIHGNAGDDTIIGGDHEDTLNGNPGDDVMWGNAGDDIMDGGADDDTMNGGTGDDAMSGGLGGDTINGGLGADIMCGGNNAADIIYEGDTDYESPGDILWGQHAKADLYCGSKKSQSDYETTSISHDCTGTTISSEPGECP